MCWGGFLGIRCALGVVRFGKKYVEIYIPKQLTTIMKRILLTLKQKASTKIYFRPTA